MTTQELNAMTVLELRKVAKENGVKLGAGVTKSDIVAKIAAATEKTAETPVSPVAPAEAPAPAETTTPAEAPVPDEAPAAAPEAPQEKPAQPQFKAAWHNPAPRYNSKPAYQAPAYSPRPAWQSTQGPRTGMDQRPVTPRPSSYTRFGPGANQEATAEQREEYRPYRSEPRTGFGPGVDRRTSYSDGPRTGYTSREDSPYSRSYGSRAPYQPREQATYQPREQMPYQPREQMPFQQPQDSSAANPAVNELLAAGACEDGGGVLELHPDGYGFLRSDYFLPSNRDIYVSMAQIRRFALRTGDRISGKTRPRRDGDKYTAMLYITEVNGQTVEEAQARPAFDELTPIYPNRRIDLESHDGQPLDDMRLIDLIAPLGFGQRGLILFPSAADKATLLEHFARVISTNHPEAQVFVLLIDETPEDVTMFREQVPCTVLASTFDQPPETHLRLADMVLERAQRLVELGKDVVLIVDSLTRLAKIYPTNAAPQGQSIVNPTSLFRAKKLFGAARSLKEGGSLTIIGAMLSGSKVDDSIAQEFKGTANMELTLDAALVHAGIKPPIDLQLSGTKRAEALLTEAQQEGLQLVRNMLGSSRSSTAIPQIISLMNKTDSNDAFLVKFKEWVSLMNKSR